MKLRFLGAIRTVTGSCFHLSVNGMQLLVDCGMHQGKDSHEINKMAFPFNPEEIDCLFLTHAHIDHSGLIPLLVKRGFKGRIITTPATADLAEILLYDTANIQEKDAEWLTIKSFRAGEEIVYEPLYTADDVTNAMVFFDRKGYDSTGHPGDGIRYRFIDAGHILGSATLELWYKEGHGEKKIVFSGDIGKKDSPIINDPISPESADYVVIESTYGNRLHKDMEQSIDELVEIIKTTFQNRGNVLIPSFAVGRTQDVLYVLNKLSAEKRLDRLKVYVDSPLAEKATHVYLSHPECFDTETVSQILEKKNRNMKLHFTHSMVDSQKINNIKSGAIIIAGSGMCDGGRITHHFKHNLWRSECSVIFVGFQAKGTLGRKIVEGAVKVNVRGENIAVKARICTIGGFSAHADRAGLLEWLSAFSNKPEVFVVHGEEDVALEFADTVKGKLGLVTRVPAQGDEFEI